MKNDFHFLINDTKKHCYINRPISYKRWKVINFFNQGDREIIAGRQPVPIMNRIYTDQQALHQVCRIVHLSGTIDARNHATSSSPDSLFVF